MKNNTKKEINLQDYKWVENHPKINRLTLIYSALFIVAGLALWGAF